jgi:hypothetical protein
VSAIIASAPFRFKVITAGYYSCILLAIPMGDVALLLYSYAGNVVRSTMIDHRIAVHELKNGGAIVVRAETMVNVQWVRSYEEGLEQARQMGKPMLLDFFKDG